MLRDHPQVLPRPGPVWGPYPQRPPQDRAGPWRRPRWRRAASRCRHIADAAPAHADAWAALAANQRDEFLRSVRARLRREGLSPSAIAQALGIVVATAAMTLGWTARGTQRLGAAALLDGRLAEMATGEGKTLTVALAAAVAALAGMPVHVITANDYLAARDATRMAPLFEALGLRVSSLVDGGDEAHKRFAYGHDLLYTTAKTLAFDHLRDRQAMATRSALERRAAVLTGEVTVAPVMRGLCMAILDEADSILLDEAETPLILARHTAQSARRGQLWQALALARQLRPGQDFTLHVAERRVTLSDAGEVRSAILAGALDGPWRRARYRREALVIALAALHAFRRDTDYVLRDGRVEVLDAVTGRIAPGRIWSRGLHSAIALKEGLAPPPETETTAQTTFQRFFQRYWRLCGISGTLSEAAAELREVYGADVIGIPLHRPCQRQSLPMRRFNDRPAMLAALAERVTGLRAAGRPVLIGTDSVADSMAASAVLTGCGIAHQVLNAINDADEAAIVAAAGRAGQVTVATRMAGRGTDIELDDAARAAGGLHVLSCQTNPSRRLDRQLAGRAGRQGQPGSEETWTFTCFQGLQTAGEVPMMSAWTQTTLWGALSPAWLLRAQRRYWQWRQEGHGTERRRELLRQDLEWERRLSFAGSPA